MTPFLAGFCDELEKLAYTPTGPSRNPFRAFDNTRKETVFKGDMSKTQGMPELRTPVMPSMYEAANKPFRDKTPAVQFKPPGQVG